MGKATNHVVHDVTLANLRAGFYYYTVHALGREGVHDVLLVGGSACVPASRLCCALGQHTIGVSPFAD